jgi:hypothetical protein
VAHAKLLRRGQLARESETLGKALKGIDDADKRKELNVRLADTVMKYVQAQLEFDLLSHGEELDVNRVMIESAGTLKLTRDEIRHAAAYYRDRVALMLKTLDRFKELIGQEGFQRLAASTEGGKKLLLSTIDLLNDHDARYSAAARWFDANLDKFN